MCVHTNVLTYIHTCDVSMYIHMYICIFVQVYVGGLGIRADEGDLRLLMEPFGTLTDVSVVRDNDTELSRG